MTPEQREELKQAALAAKGWNWNATQGDQFGREEDGSFYDIGTVDADQYSQGGEGEDDYNGTVLRFIAKADPSAILSLIAQVEALTVPHACPMSTAPHDGTEVLAWSKTGKTWHQVYWKTQENGDWLFLPPFPPRWACRWNEAYYQGQAEFSHWTPIPSDPTIPAIPGTKEGA